MAVKDIVIDLSKYSQDDYQLENLENYTYIENNSVPTIESLLVECGSVDVEAAYGAPQAPGGTGCTSTKYSGNSINLAASPNGAVGPYHVRFWRKPNVSGVMTWGEIGAVRNVSEGSSTSTSFTLYDTDLVAASGQSGALTPDVDTAGNISESGVTVALAVGKIRVATTVYDSCPITPMTCLSYCDVTLGCVAPTCNFTVL